MQSNNKEAQMLLAIEGIRKDKKLSIRKAAKLYNISHTTLIRRMNGLTPHTEFRPKSHNLTDLEEEVLIQYILDIDERGFSPRISDVEDMANYILETRGVKKVGKLWAHRFMKRYTELKTRFNCVYDFQRAFCEDSELIERWFRLVSNMQAKYGILDCDFYNFDEIGFMMGQISSHIVVTKADRYGRSKAIQSGNREWATAIICVDGEGHNIPSFLIVKGEYHLSNWYTEGDLLYDWLIKPTTNGWTDNETGLEWIKHFNKYTESRKVGRYRMLVLDEYESYKSSVFQEYYKEHNIILFSLLFHSSHLTQSFDIDCFDLLKCSYNRQIENFIKAYITYITKTEFFQAFKAQSQTSYNPIKALFQSTLMKSRIARHQGSSSTPIFETVAALAKGTELLAYTNTLLIVEIHNLHKANEALSKHRRIKKALIRKGGALSVGNEYNILEQKNVDNQIQCDEYTNDDSSTRRQATIQRCSKCSSTSHNARTCQLDPALIDP
ncbi:hypothetical protein SS1G_12118 [Sclerotinia sclerotiorum 1980 UF-70]|uniref:HTH CENPB-type domain-containing protein n=1 Tax=Sclerotinia sclerotiorum (strain ATCC 18683 / 1980 / Ss-1) TaxID=665079 RepID=A7F2H1_SCLS1|nr:hypothetical protein SS1G_12118 [Sclerotinia sclerotiorum 1980 UF-70]EDN95913.1 hypothetical protein SS1G_12118 [Sclerotinia sclerotiorum 1980 UF-70]